MVCRVCVVPPEVNRGRVPISQGGGGGCARTYFRLFGKILLFEGRLKARNVTFLFGCLVYELILLQYITDIRLLHI